MTAIESDREARVSDSVSCALWIVMRCVGLVFLCLSIVEVPDIIGGTMNRDAQADMVAEVLQQSDANYSKLIVLLNEAQENALLASWVSCLMYLCFGVYLTRRGSALHKLVSVIPSKERGRKNSEL